jgi:hypothetical protein
MKKTNLLAILTLAATPTFLHAQTTVYSEVVGYSTENLPAGLHFFSPSFLKAPVYTGTATLSGNVVSGITVSGGLGLTTFTNRANFPTHYLEITSGSYAGTYYNISSNTASSVVLAETPNVDAAGSVSVAIRPHVTLGDVIKADSGIGEYSDSISVYDNNGGFTPYYFAGGVVTADDFLTEMSHVPIAPGKGVGINTGANLNVTTTGVVRKGNLKVPIYKGAVNVVGAFNPSSATKLTDLALATELNPYSDSVVIYNSTGNLGLIAIAYSNGDNVTDDQFNAYTSATSPSVSTKGSMLFNPAGGNLYITLPGAVQ